MKKNIKKRIIPYFLNLVKTPFTLELIVKDPLLVCMFFL